MLRPISPAETEPTTSHLANRRELIVTAALVAVIIAGSTVVTATGVQIARLSNPNYNLEWVTGDSGEPGSVLPDVDRITLAPNRTPEANVQPNPYLNVDMG